jgi:cytoskeletal protein CcmA (bactofilin family)
MIGKSLQIKGEVIGCESLYIDGKIEGAINLPESQVTVGYPQVLANITAREVVNLGTVRGSCQCQRPCGHSQQSSLTGDVTTGRIIIGDRAFFKGGIDISNPS